MGNFVANAAVANGGLMERFPVALAKRLAFARLHVVLCQLNGPARWPDQRGNHLTAAREKLVAWLRGERRLRRRGHLIAQARQLTPSANNQEVEGTSRLSDVTTEPPAACSILSENVIASRLFARRRCK